MAEEEKKQEQKEQQGQGEGSEKGEKKKGSNTILFFGIIGGIVVINLIMAFILFNVTRPKSEEDQAAEVAVDSAQTVMEETTAMGATSEPIEAVVNIADTDGERFLKVVVILEYNESNKDLPEELVRRAPRFKNILIDQLSQMTLMELSEPAAKEKIRKEFLRRINSTLPPKIGEVSNVYLDQFIIQ
ncbi:MAG: hypothetical protein GF401_10450 [Chitinivibrionales bacterium]|nr:hypothetical protein [Chitinivibrionales bacterium]